MKSLLQGFNSSFKQQKKDAVNLYIGKAKSPYVMNTKRKKKNRDFEISGIPLSLPTYA